MFCNTLLARYSEIQDLTGLEYATSLQDLELDDNQIIDISALSGLTNLQDLYLENNQIIDISSLAGNNGLGSGDTILLNNNYLDISNPDSPAMAVINTLIGRGANVAYQPQH